MLTPDHLHDYQKKAVNHQCTHPQSMLWLDLGLGKTAVTLTSIAHLIRSGYLRSVLIVAPIRVCRLVWRQEAAKWAHTSHLSFSMIVGTKDQRTRALLRPADVYILNFDCLGWLADTLATYFVKKNKPLPFNGLVWDEISKMKNSSTERVKSFRRVADHFDWTTGLTGTPASNGYKDLHGQFLVVDKGQRLGKTKTEFKTRFYYKVGPYKELAFPDTEDTIKQLVGDITLEMSAADYNPLPDLIVNNIELEMEGKPRDIYEKLEKEYFAQLDSGTDVEVFNAASLTNKLIQLSGGAIYPVPGMPMWEHIHDLKLDELEDIIDELQGQPLFCTYQFKHEAERIAKRFAHLAPINMTELKSERALIQAMERWKRGDCALMIGHPACLHPWTQVLTESRGWVKIVDVTPHERVFDGVEFVSHDGCSYSGYRDVIDVFGITMTPDHKLLVNGKWEEARSAGARESARREALYQFRQVNENGRGAVSELLSSSEDREAKLRQAQQGRSNLLRGLCRGVISQYDSHQTIPYLARVTSPGERHQGQKLRGPWNFCRSTLGVVRDILGRYVPGLFGRLDYRAHRCERSLLQGELSLGYQYGAAGEQTHQQELAVQGRNDSPCGTGTPLRSEQDDAANATEQGNDPRGSSERRNQLALREGTESQRKAHVFDLVNCGPRHQFLIRNEEGEMFISHNSVGHGIDGLQETCFNVCWFGLTWSLDLYDQFNGRIRRQGQKRPVVCHRLLVRNTMDQAQALALDEKATTQAGLRDAVKQYRREKGA